MIFELKRLIQISDDFNPLIPNEQDNTDESSSTGFEIERIAKALGANTNGFEIEQIAEKLAQGGSGGGGDTGIGLMRVYYRETTIGKFSKHCLSLTPEGETLRPLRSDEAFDENTGAPLITPVLVSEGSDTESISVIHYYVKAMGATKDIETGNFFSYWIQFHYFEDEEERTITFAANPVEGNSPFIEVS